jgi:hypothetical protein
MPDTTPVTPGNPMGGSKRWQAIFPPLQWPAAYQRQWLVHDAVAGVTLAAYAIPVALAYASLAGLPPPNASASRRARR